MLHLNSNDPLLMVTMHATIMIIKATIKEAPRPLFKFLVQLLLPTIQLWKYVAINSLVLPCDQKIE